MNRQGFHWTKEEFERAKQMRAEGKLPTDIGLELGRSPDAVEKRLCWRVGPSTHLRFETGTVSVPDFVIERQFKLLATPPRDLTAHLCGDPKPGFSALDGR